MHILIAAIGKIKEPYLRDGILEYQKRLSGFCQLRILEYSEERIRDSSVLSDVRSASQREGQALLKSFGPSDLVIALDPRGKQVSSDQLATLLKQWDIHGPNHIGILIGGPHGLSDEVRSRSDMLLSLSAMTFPHQVIRLLILEQVYRAFTIMKGLPYHR